MTRHTWHLSKHVRQSTESLPVQFHSVGHEGAFQEEVVPHPLRHGCWDENTQILQEQTGQELVPLKHPIGTKPLGLTQP